MSTDLRILVTGSRHHTERELIRRALLDAIDRWQPEGGCGYVTVVHGGAPGADTIAGEIAHELRCVEEIHRADWARYGRRAGPLRNAAMVRAGADVVLAFPLGASSGTRGCIALAVKARIPVTVHEAVVA